jgi:hypothetical protein
LKEVLGWVAAKPDKLLLVKGITGLGDRILCALGGILYAQLSGRTLVIDWSDPFYSSNGDNVFHRFFESPFCSPTDDIPTTDSVYPRIWQGRLVDHAIQIAREREFNPQEIRRALSIDFGKLDYLEDLLVMVEYDAPLDRLRPYFHGAFQQLAQMTTEGILAKMLREDLLLQSEVRARVDHFKSNHFYARTVGVHVRYSDYRVRLFAIIKQLNALLKREPDLQIFLATDNIEVQKMFDSNFPRVVSTPHWYAQPGSPIHVDRTRLDPTETAIEALIDLYLLASCDHLIFDGSSSFAWVANLLSPAAAHDKLDVDPTGHERRKRRLRAAVTRILRGAKFSSWGFRLLPKLVPIRRL